MICLSPILLFTMIHNVMPFPEGFILKVVPHCGDGTQDGKIEVISDLTISASAKCDNGLMSFDEVADDAHCSISVTFDDDDSAPCLMTKREGADVYTATVYVGWGETGSPLITNKEQFLATCSFGSRGSEQSVEKAAAEALVAPTELQHHQGPAMTSEILLHATDVLGQPLPDSVSTGRKIQLQAVSDGNDGEVGIRPSSCDIIGVNSHETYAILRAGCGDGIVFSKSQGFTTRGLESHSPYFHSFHVNTDAQIKFSCNFTVCDTNCDGSSCLAAKRKRSLFSNPHEILDIVSSIYTVVGNDSIHQRKLVQTEVTSPKPDDQLETADETPLPWIVTLMLSGFAILCIVSVSLSLYSFILIRQERC